MGWLKKYQNGGYSTAGYKADSPDRNNPYNIIPSGRITMQNVPHPVMGIDNRGNAQYMVPGAEYQFPGETVFEVPAMKEGGIPQRYKNMGFTRVGQKKTGDGQHKWKVLAKKGDSYKVVQGGYRGMQDFKQHGSQERRDRFWDRMGGRDSAKAKDPFSPLYWHKRFGTWEYGGPVPSSEMYKDGGMIKRADGSYSQRGLWDNIRANAGSGKRPTKEMLQQEMKIRSAEKKQYGGWLDQYQFGGGMYMPTTSGSSPFMPASKAVAPVVQQAPSFLTGVPEGIDLNTKLGYMEYLQDSIGDESRKRIIDREYNEKDPTIVLNRGNFRNAKVNTKVIDDAVASARKKGIPAWQMLGMVGQETALGTNRRDPVLKFERPNSQRFIASGWNTKSSALPEDFVVYMAGHGVPGVKATKLDMGYVGTILDKDAAEKYLQKHPRVIDTYRKSQSVKVPTKEMSEFDYAANYLKEKGVKGYNPNDSDYRNKVNARIEELSSDPAFMNYVKQKGYNLGEARQYEKGGWLSKYK